MLSYIAGAVVLQPFNPFDHVNIREAIRNLECSGNETHVSQCDIDSEEVEDCGQFEIAGVVCQSMHIVTVCKICVVHTTVCYNIYLITVICIQVYQQ